MGAGIRPPRVIKPDAVPLGTDIIAALPKRPPKETSSPTPFPGTGMSLTAVVLWLITPIALSLIHISHNGNGRNAYPLVYNRDSIAGADFIADRNKPGSIFGKLCPDIAYKKVKIVACAVEKADPKRNGANIQVLVPEHIQSGCYFSVGKH